MGRGRKAGDRYVSGKLKPVGTIRSGAAWQRLIQENHRLATDERVVTQLGRLSWFGEITHAQTAAGMRIGGIYGRYEALNGLRRSAKSGGSPSYVSAADEAEEESRELKTPAEVDESARNATTAFKGLQREIPMLMRSLVEALCVEDEAVNPLAYPDLRVLFQRLAILWKMTGGARRDADEDPARRHTPLHFNKHDEAAEFQQAVRDRENFRKSKAQTKRTSVP